MRKRVLSLCMVLAMCLSLLPIPVLADEEASDIVQVEDAQEARNVEETDSESNEPVASALEAEASDIAQNVAQTEDATECNTLGKPVALTLEEAENMAVIDSATKDTKATVTLMSGSNITVYFQTDSDWGGYPYGKGDPYGRGYNYPVTIGESGCGLVSITNAVHYLTGKRINPKTLADYALDNGYRVPGGYKNGDYGAFVKSFCNNRGSQYDVKFVENVTKISSLKSHLQQNCAAIFHVDGHIMAVVKYENSKFLILDSYPSSNRGTYPNGYAWKTEKQFSGMLASNTFHIIQSTKPDNSATLDVNGLLDGNVVGWTTGYGTFDIQVGDRFLDDVSDFCEELPAGTSYKITDIKATDSHVYQGSDKALEGIVNETTDIALKFDTLYGLDVNGILDGNITGWVTGYGTFDIQVGDRFLDDVTDFCEWLPYGTAYKITDVKAVSGRVYQGCEEPLEGVLNATMAIALKFGTDPYLINPIVYNADYYRNAHTDLLNAFGDNNDALLYHWLTIGIDEGRQASPAFSPAWYLKRHTDVANALGGKNYRGAVAHFFEHGAGEWRETSEEFFVNIYRENYEDLREAFDDDVYAYFLHYITYGKAEDRIANRLLDKEPPKVTDANLTNVSPDKCTLTVTATDNVGVDRVNFHAFYGKWTAAGETVHHAVKSGNNWSYDVPLTLSNGQEWSIDVRVYDAEGNQALAKDNYPFVVVKLRACAVTFDANGGSCDVSGKSVISASYGIKDGIKSRTYVTAYGDLSTPTRNGYAFDGWYTAASGGTKVTKDTTVTATADHTLYAHWREKDTEPPKVTDANLTDVSADKCTLTVTATDNVGVERVDFHAFYGKWTAAGENVHHAVKSGNNWSYDVPLTLSNGQEWSIDVRVYDAEGNQALAKDNYPFVVVKLRACAVAFDANGGSCDVSGKSVISASYGIKDGIKSRTYVTAYGDLPVLTRNGYTFNGWYTAVDGGELVTADSKVTATENHTLYAHWTQIPEERNLTSIEINSRPNKTTYDVGEAFDSAGLSIKATYSNGDSEILTSGFSISDFDSSSAGTKDITVTYYEKTASFSIVVKEIDKPQIVVGNGNASREMTIDIPVTIQSNPGIAGAMLAISYDKSALTLNKIAQGPLFEHGSYSAPSEIGIVQWYHTEDVKEDGVLFILQFTVNETAQNGNYNISVGLRDDVAANLSNADSKIVDAQFISGVLEITSGIRGDVTGDGVVAINDVVKVARAVAGSLTLTESEKALADVTGDGVIAINDVVKLARYVAGSVATLQSAEAASLSGGESAVIEVATVSGKSGGTVQVPVSVTSNPGIAGAQLDISFDEGLTLKKIAKGDILSAGTFNPDVDNGRIQWYYDQANVTNIGVLFTLEFEISANANNGDAYAVTVSVKDGITANLSDYDFNPVNAEFKAGKVQVGDTSGNAVISTVSRNGNTVTANVVCADSNASVFCGVYNNSGKMIAVRSVQITSESTYRFQFDGQQFDYAKVFILDSNFCPLCESKRS